MLYKLYSKGCLEKCSAPGELSEDTATFLAELGTQTCPGLAHAAKGVICSLPGEATEAILARQPDAPGTMVYEALCAVIAGKLAPQWLPSSDHIPAYETGPMRWRWIAIMLDEINGLP